MIEARSYRGGRCTEHAVADIDALVTSGGDLLWVDVTEPDDAELEEIAARFGLHPLSMEDVRKHQQRPKLERYPTHAFIVAKSRELDEVDVFVGPSWVVTVREAGDDGTCWPVDGARARFERLLPQHVSPGFLLYVLLDELVDGYFGATDEAEELLEAIEDRIFSETPGDERLVQAELFEIRRRLLHFRRAVVPLREVVGALLRREVPYVDDQAAVHLQDVYDHVLRAIDQLDVQRELLGNAVDAHLAIISNNMNQVMKRMTSWGAILLGSALVAGIYGMNFEHMPELGWRFGYAWALGLMGAITGAGYWFFRRRDWL